MDFKIDFAANEHIGPAVAYAGWINNLVGDTDTMTPEKIAGFHASFALVLFMLGRFLGTWLMSKTEPRKVLLWYSVAAVALVALAFAIGGSVGILCIMLTYFCQSIMFPTIFALATKGLPPAEAKMASSLVIMAIVGGAVMPPIAGLLSGAGGMKLALLIPLLCFSYVVYYVMSGYRQK